MTSEEMHFTEDELRGPAEAALDRAKKMGADYADIRISRRVSEEVALRNGRPSRAASDDDSGFGIRVIADGAWGFAAASRIDPEEIEAVAELAVRTARASARLMKQPVRLAGVQPVRTSWHSPYIIDPFTVPLDGKLSLLSDIDRVLRADPRIVVSEGSIDSRRETIYLATSEGSRIYQSLLRTGAGFKATAVAGDEVQVRSYPNSFGGQYMAAGYELVRSLDLLENAERIREEAVMLLSADDCPQGDYDVIIDGNQLALQIHESAGHPSELDRVLGMEAGFAGTSFLTTDKLGSFRYGSEKVNLIADATVPLGLATRGYDDDGVRSGRWHIVHEGLLTGYHTNRELAGHIGETESRGANRADGWWSVPMIRISNLSLAPGRGSRDDLISDTPHGVLLSTNRSWSIDQMRLNFQFSTEIAWEIKNGRLTRPFKNPVYQGMTPGFWGSMDAVCGAGEWTLWGLIDCGKGEPIQTAAMSHGAAPARFRKVRLGTRPG